ncbi:hypothetical protein E8E11_002970 [Didymella keratinophila]|nr:hypothetical protein E8E11_002970 [Didymella keratinophila]
MLSKIFNSTEGSWSWDAFASNISGEDYGTMNIYKEDISISLVGTSPDPSDTGPPRAMFGLSNTTASYVSQVFDDYLPSSYTAMTDSDRPILRYRNYLDGPSLRKLQFNPLLAPNNITRYMERLATALTNVVLSDVDSYETVSGLSYNRKQFVAVT